MLPYEPTPVHELKDPRAERAGIRVLVKREDLNHSTVSGNKWWKLRYNLQAALDAKKTSLLTLGGAYSNHIYATAAAAAACGLKSIGIIRGEEHLPLNPTLAAAVNWGMTLHYVTRSKYRERNQADFLDTLQKKWNDAFIIPEGGTNVHALRGLQEFGALLSTVQHDYLCLPVGTGGTLAGLATSGGRATILGFVASKDTSLPSKITELIQMSECSSPSPWQLVTNYHFGGFAKMSDTLRAFIDDFHRQHGILLDPVYTCKMMFGVFDLIAKGYFPLGSTVLVLHTGGLQGWGNGK
jgi:1-aminocyclopropane-1-carboxylate deaminase